MGRPIEIAPLRDFDVGVVDVFVDVLGPAEHADEARHLPEKRPLPFLLRAGAAAGQNPLGRLDDDGDHTAGASALVDDRRVVEIHPDLLGVARAMKRHFLVAIRQRLARKPDLHHVVVEIGDLGPSLADLAAQEPGMAPTGKAGIGVVVDHDPVGSPEKDDRDRRVDEEADDRLQALRPVRDRGQGRRPVVSRDQSGHFAASGQERQGTFGRNAVLQVFSPVSGTLAVSGNADDAARKRPATDQ